MTNRKPSVKVLDTISSSKLNCGVPQGLCTLATAFYYVHCFLSVVISGLSGIKENASTSIPQLQNCLKLVQDWMAASKLKLNPSKTEFILIGSANQRKLLSALFPINILGNKLSPVENVCNLGVMSNAGFSFPSHMSPICKQCSYHICDQARIRRFLSKSFAITLANSLVFYVSSQKLLGILVLVIIWKFGIGFL